MKKLFLLLCCAVSMYANAQTQETTIPELSLSYTEITGANGFYYNANGEWEQNLNMINCLNNHFANYQLRSIICGGNSYTLFLNTHTGYSSSESIDAYLTNDTSIDYYLIDTREYSTNTAAIDKDGTSAVKFTILKQGNAKNLDDVAEQCASICTQKLVADKKNPTYLVFQTQFMKEEGKARFLFFATSYVKKQYTNPFPQNCGISKLIMTNDIFKKAYFEVDYNTLAGFVF
jgi:hypothetical protein